MSVVAVSLLQALTGFEFDVVPLDPADTAPVHIKMADVVGCVLVPSCGMYVLSLVPFLRM